MSNDTPASTGIGSKAVDWTLATIAGIVSFVLMLKLGAFHATPPDSLDGAWQAALQFAWLNGLQIGRDIVFPHGPYGAFYAHLYHPDLVGLWYAIRLSHAVVLAIALVWTLRVVAGPGLGWRILACGLALIAAAAMVPGPDGIWMLAPFLLIGLAIDTRNTPPLLVVLLVAAIALATLAKFSFLVMGVTALIAWSVAAAFRRDPMALLAIPLYVAAVVLLWIAAGQELSGFVDWLRVSFQVGSGYGAAMSLTSNRYDLLVYGALVVLLLLGIWVGFRSQSSLVVKGIVLLGWLALFMFVAKAGFVRHDGHAVFPFEMAVAAAALVVAQGLPPRKGAGQVFALQLLVLVGAAGWLTVAHTRLTPSGHTIDKQIAGRIVHAPALLLEIANDLLSEHGKAAHYRDYADKSRALLGGPHPRIASATSIDVYSYMIAPPILAGLPYHPRPVIQSYQSYMPALAERDVKDVRRDGAEVYVLQVGSIDNRPPLADGGHLWPEFLSLYDPVDEVPLGLLIERRTEPVPLETRKLVEGRKTYNRWIELPAPNPGAILQVKGGIRPTLLGRAFGLVFKPPQLTITLRRADGSEQTHRLVPGQLDAGFPVSPLVTTPQEVHALFEGEAAGAPVVAFQINAGQVQQAFWGSDFPLTVTEIHRPGQG